MSGGPQQGAGGANPMAQLGQGLGFDPAGQPQVFGRPGGQPMPAGGPQAGGPQMPMGGQPPPMGGQPPPGAAQMPMGGQPPPGMPNFGGQQMPPGGQMSPQQAQQLRLAMLQSAQQPMASGQQNPFITPQMIAQLQQQTGQAPVPQRQRPQAVRNPQRRPKPAQT